MGKSPISLKMLIDAGYINPGSNVLSIELKKKKVEVRASLTTEGVITYDHGQETSDPSGWSLYVKNLYNPDLTSDRGWTSVWYENETLKVIRQRYVSDKIRMLEEELMFLKNIKC